MCASEASVLRSYSSTPAPGSKLHCRGAFAQSSGFAVVSLPQPRDARECLPLTPEGTTAPILHPETPERSVVVAVEGDQD